MDYPDNWRMSDDINKRISASITDYSQKRDSIILQQIGELIKSGALIIVETQPVIVMNALLGSPHHVTEFRLESAIKLELRDQHVIQALEAKVALLQAQLDSVRKALDNV